MDIATIIGVVLGFTLIIGAILAGGTGIQIFINIPSLAVTIGGMICSVLIHFSLPQFLSVFSIMKKTIITKIPSSQHLIQNMVNFAAINRRDGALALEQEIRKVQDSFFVKGLQMLVDGQDVANIRELMELETQYLQERHATGKKILDFMGASAPAFGMIGTLIGLVQMLQNMSDPSSIGVGMATALLTTFYGAFIANPLFIPLAGKLSIYSAAERTSMEMITEGVCTIAQGENPKTVRERLQTFMSKSRREEIKATI